MTTIEKLFIPSFLFELSPHHLLLTAGHHSSLSDPLSVSLIIVLVYKHLVTVFQLQNEDKNSTCSGTPHTFLCLSVSSFLCLVIFSSLSLFQSPTTNSPASPITSSTVQFFFFFTPLCHRSLLQSVAQSRLSDTEMMQKDKTI